MQWLCMAAPLPGISSVGRVDCSIHVGALTLLLQETQVMSSLPLPPTEDLLRRLPVCLTAIEHLLDAQPDFATLMAAHLRQALANLVPGTPLDPDAVFLNEYEYDAKVTDTQVTDAQDSPARQPRVTRTRSLTQVLQEAIATGKKPTEHTKEPQTGVVTQAVGFYASAHDAGRDGDITALEVTAINQLISNLRHDSLALYSRRLDVFWTSAQALTGALSVFEAISQKQRVVFVLESDLKTHDALQEVTQAEQALQKKPTDTQALANVTAAKAHLKMHTEGRQLIDNLVHHETSGTATRPQVVAITLYSTGLPEWSAALNGCFVLTERLHGSRPTVLYTPQFGVEVFEHFSVMENTLRRRLVAGAEKSRLLTNVALTQRHLVDEGLRSGQNLRYTPITGPVFNACLQAQRDQQEADIDQAFSALPTTFDTLATALSATLALPLKGSPSLSARVPAPVDPITLPALAHTPPDPEQQAQLIQLWHSLNQQIEYVLALDKHPSLEGVLSALLKETFPQQAHETAFHVNRYRTDSDGQRHLESSQSMLEALCALLRWEDEPQEQAHHTEGVFSSATAFSAADQIPYTGTLTALAQTLLAKLTAHITTYWHTPIAPELACPQARLIEVHRQALDVQARLGMADNTLSPQAKRLIDHALHYPTLARREARFSHGNRPGVYQLTLNTGDAEGVRLAGSFVLTSSDDSRPVLPHWPYGHKNLSTHRALAGTVVLYTPSQGFEEFATLQTLHDTLKVRIDTADDTGRLLIASLPLLVLRGKTGLWGSDLRNTFAPIESDFVADSIQALLDKQQSDIEAILGLAEGEPDPQSNGRVELVELLDMAEAFVARNQRLLEHWRPDWEKRLSPADQKALQDQLRTADEKQHDLSTQWSALIPTLAEYARQQVRLKIRALLPDYPAQVIDPDQTMVIRTTRTRISAGAGFGSVHEQVVPSRVSLTNLLLQNNKPWSRSLSWTEDDTLEANLTTAQGNWLRDAQGKVISLDKERLELWVKELNIGHEYTENILKKHLAPQTRTALEKAWMASQAATLDYAALLARLSPDAYSTVLASDPAQKKGAAWIAAVLAATDPKARQPVDGQAIIANALMFNPASDAPEGRGGQTVNGVLILSTAVDAMRVLYTPHAPDSVELREIASEAELIKLMRTSAWQAYLQARLPANTRLLNHRLVAHPGDVLEGLYQQNYLYLLDKTDTESVTNEELAYQSTFNKVMFGVEVVTTVLGGFPWAGHLTSSAFRWVGRMGRTTVQALRKVGQNVAGLIVRRGAKDQVLFELATATTTVTGATRTAGIGIKPLQMLLRPARNTRKPDLTAYETAFQQASPTLVVKGGIPAGSSLSEGTGIYRTASNPTQWLVRAADGQGKEQVFRIQNSFNLYDPHGLVAPVLTPRGGVTPFKLRKLANQHWALDTLNRVPGGGPKADSAVAVALRDWNAHVVANAQSANPLTTLNPADFFRSRAIPVKTWNKFVKQSGEINAAGLARLSPAPTQGYAKFTDELFNTWVGLGDETEAAADAFFRAHRISPTVWARYVTRGGKLTEPGMTRSIRLANLPSGVRSKITDQHLQDWDRLYLRPEIPRTTPITKAEVMNYAFEHRIHIDSWMKYVSPKGGVFLRHNPAHTARLERLGIPSTPPQTTPIDLSATGPSTQAPV